MGFEDVDLKEIMKQVGRELGGAFGADENTFLPNDGKTTMPDWKAMMGKGKRAGRIKSPRMRSLRNVQSMRRR